MNTSITPMTTETIRCPTGGPVIYSMKYGDEVIGRVMYIGPRRYGCWLGHVTDLSEPVDYVARTKHLALAYVGAEGMSKLVKSRQAG